MEYRREHRSLVVALVVSAVLHVAVLGWVRAHQPRDLAPVRPDVIELTWLEVAPPAAPTAPEPPTPPRQNETATSRATPAARTPDRAPPTPKNEVPPPPAVDRPVDDSPRAGPGLLTTSLDSNMVIRLFDAGVDDEPTPGLHAPRVSEDLVGDLAKETIGRGRVDRGLVHPYYSQLGKALMKNWDADRVLAQGGLKAYGQQLGENFKLSNQVWLNRAEAYGKSGNPLGPTSADAPVNNRVAPMNDRIGGLPAPDLAARQELARQNREIYKATRRATIRVVQDAQGKLLKVELVDPSNDPTVDREAVKDVRAAAEKLPTPPPEVTEHRTTISSLWSFELIISISPPVPTFTFEFDEALGFIDARLPLDRRIYKKVRLVSVE